MSDSNICESQPTAGNTPPHVLLLQEIPMNFVDPKEYDIPGLVRKNRYKTILPSEYSLPLRMGTGSPSPRWLSP